MIAWLLKWLTSGFLDRLLDYYTKKADRNAQVATELIKAEIETRRAQKEILVNESGWAVSRWMRPFVFYPLALHLNLVILDSIFSFSWNVERLPSPMDQWQGAIILSFFLVKPIEGLANVLGGYFKR